MTAAVGQTQERGIFDLADDAKNEDFNSEFLDAISS